MSNNIEKKDIQKKCTLCGNCAAICPKNAIKYDNKKERTIIDKQLCINCGLCIKNCPTSDKVNSSSILGNIENVYAGFANSKEIRYKAASGGILTQTLKYLIENKIVDKVLISDFDKDKIQSEARFTENIDDIINACGSKYQIINVNKSLKTVLKENLTFAYVGLPCHHNGLEKFIKENPQIKNRIKYKFAICCSHNCSINIIEYIAKSLKIKKEDIHSIKYRGDGWPEYLKITLNNGENVKFSKQIWNDLFLSFFFTPKQCFNCKDFCGEHSDLSFADAWLQEYTKEVSDGFNLIFSHNKKAEELLQKMSAANIITLNKHCYSDIIKSQAIGLFYKKYLYPSKKITDVLLKTLLRLNSQISTYKFFNIVNHKLLRYYFIMLNLLFIKSKIKRFKEQLLNENCNR